MTRPVLLVSLTRAGGAIDLTDVISVTLWVGDEFDLIVDGQQMDVVDPVGGTVSYGFISSEVAEAGRYKCQIQLDFDDGRTERNYFSIDFVIAEGRYAV